MPALSLHERLQVGDRPLHRPSALHYLWQEHLAGAEQLADDLHAVHQRPFDHRQRPRVLLPRFLGVRLDEVDDAMHQRMGEPRFDGRLAPGEVGRAPGARAPDLLRKRHHPFGGV